MAATSEFDTWSAGQSYDYYMGRWSCRIAKKFLEWLAPPSNADWLEIGCGTGALTGAILAQCAPRHVVAIDPSADFIAHARNVIKDERVRFDTAGALNLPAKNGTIDVVSSALALNFVSNIPAALREAQRALRDDGLLSFYVWDYPGGGMGFIDAFWKAAIEIDREAHALDESIRFSFCTRKGLTSLCLKAGLASPFIEAIEVETEFADFEAFWKPFTFGTGPAPGYCMRLADHQREALKARLIEILGTTGPVRLPARAWAVKTGSVQGTCKK